jgi:hypothetical protein
MRGLLAATAAVGVLAIGGLPALALTLAGEETGPEHRRAAVSQRAPGPPPWAHEKARGWMRHHDRVPPGWARNHAGRTPHGWAVRTWAHCVADAAAGLAPGEKLDPVSACGERPERPHHAGR